MKVTDIKEDKSTAFYDDYCWSLIFKDNSWVLFDGAGQEVSHYSDFSEAIQRLYEFDDDIEVIDVSASALNEWTWESHEDKDWIQKRVIISTYTDKKLNDKDYVGSER